MNEIEKKKVGNFRILGRLIKYAFNMRAWDSRLHLAFLSCEDGYLRLFEKRKATLACGCRLNQIRQEDHKWILELDFTNCRDHKEGYHE